MTSYSNQQHHTSDATTTTSGLFDINESVLQPIGSPTTVPTPVNHMSCSKRKGWKDADGKIVNLVIHDGFTANEIQALKKLPFTSKPNTFKIVTDCLKRDQMDALVELLKFYFKHDIIWKTIELEDDDCAENIPPLVRLVNQYQLCFRLRLTSNKDWTRLNFNGQQSHFLGCLSKNHKLKSLEIHFLCSFCTEGDLMELSRVLRTSSALESIDLMFETEDDKFKSLLPSLGMNTSLKRINLQLPETNSERTCDGSIQSLVSEISSHPKLKTLSLVGSKAGDDGMRALAFLFDCLQLTSLFLDFSLSGSPQVYSTVLKALVSQSHLIRFGLPTLNGLSLADMMQVVLPMKQLNHLQIARYQQLKEAELTTIAKRAEIRRTPLAVDLPRGFGQVHADSLERILVAHPGIQYSTPLRRDSRLAVRNQCNRFGRYIEMKSAIWPLALQRVQRQSVMFELLKGRILGGRESLELAMPTDLKHIASTKRKRCELRLRINNSSSKI